MQVWVATIGAYEDERIVGVASSYDGARKLIDKLRLTPGHHDVDDAVYGPFEIDEAYDRQHRKI